MSKYQMHNRILPNLTAKNMDKRFFSLKLMQQVWKINEGNSKNGWSLSNFPVNFPWI